MRVVKLSRTCLAQILSRQAKSPFNGVRLLASACSMASVFSYESSLNESHFQFRAYPIQQKDRQVTVRPTTHESYWDRVKSSLQWIADLFKLIYRVGSLMMYFSPAIVTSPLLLMGSKSTESKWWSLIRYGIFQSGPCLVKFSQWAATRPDVFPQKLCKELEFLQAHSYQHKWGDTAQALEIAYGKDWVKRLHLDHRCVTGSGSMAQVYHGYLIKEDGHRGAEVAVKVLHPGIRSLVEADLYLMDFIARTLESSASLAAWVLRGFAGDRRDSETNRSSIFDTTVPLKDTIDEFRDLMLSQIDLRREADAMLRFKHNFGGKQWANRVKFAEPIDLSIFIQSGHFYEYDENSSNSHSIGRTSSFLRETHPRDVLLQTFEHGVPMSQYLTATNDAKSAAGDANLVHTTKDKEIADLGLDIMLKMVRYINTLASYIIL